MKEFIEVIFRGIGLVMSIALFVIGFFGMTSVSFGLAGIAFAVITIASVVMMYLVVRIDNENETENED